MPYRVIQWSTGNVGTLALRCILGHPELELVGVLVHGGWPRRQAPGWASCPRAPMPSARRWPA